MSDDWNKISVQRDGTTYYGLWQVTNDKVGRKVQLVSMTAPDGTPMVAETATTGEGDLEADAKLRLLEMIETLALSKLL